jgi:uncharacterized protein
MKTKNEILIFISICLPLTWMSGIYLNNKGGLSSFFNHFIMYIPALTVILLYLFVFKKPLIKKGDLGIRIGLIKYWFLAPLLFLFLIILSYFISWLLDPSIFASTETIKSGLLDKGFYPGSIIMGIIVVFLINIVLGGIINAGIFMGEELGWRGFLIPRLLTLVKPKYAFLIGGFIWGVWHMVMIYQGLNYPGHFLFGIPMMIVFCSIVGIIIQYFYFKSGSIFAAVLSHSTINKAAMSMSFLIDKDNFNTLIYGPTGIIGLAIFAIVAVWLFRRIDWNLYNTYTGSVKQAGFSAFTPSPPRSRFGGARWGRFKKAEKLC